MTQEELDRFLESVHRTRLVDYLEVQDGESAPEALDRRLRWAARVRNQPDQAPEAMFLLKHQDALRARLATQADDYEEEWIEFADAGDEDNVGNVRMYGGGTSGDTVDLGADLSAPREPTPSRAATTAEVPRRGPAGPPPRPAAVQRQPGVPTPDGTPTPFTEQRSSPAISRPRSPSPLLDRARRGSPPPAISRLSGRARTPGATPSPTPGTRRRTPSPVPAGRQPSPRPAPGRWSSSTPAPRRTPSPSPMNRRRTPSPTPTYGAPTPGQRSATPAAPRFPTPTPGGSQYDVRIRGGERFVRSNDQYGTSQVVYDSDLDDRALGVPLPSGRTPGSVAPRDPDEPDILGSLRGGARKGTPAAVGRAAERDRGIPPAVWLSLILLLVIFISIGTYGLGAGWYDDALGLAPDRDEVQAGAAFQQGMRPGAPTTTGQTIDPTVAESDPLQPRLPGSTGPGAAPAAGSVTDAPPAADPSGSEGASGGSSSGSPGTTAPSGGTSGKAASSGGGTSGKAASSGGGTSGKTASSGGGTSSTTAPSGGSTSDTPADDASDDGGDTKASGEGDATEEAPPPRPSTAAGGIWKGTAGEASATAYFEQNGDDVRGEITIRGELYKVAGRYNEAKRSLYLKGVDDPGVVFRGTVEDGRIQRGTAKLGAGQLVQAWAMQR